MRTTQSEKVQALYDMIYNSDLDIAGLRELDIKLLTLIVDEKARLGEEDEKYDRMLDMIVDKVYEKEEKEEEPYDPAEDNCKAFL